MPTIPSTEDDSVWRRPVAGAPSASSSVNPGAPTELALTAIPDASNPRFAPGGPVEDGPVADSGSTRFVPDGPVANATSPRIEPVRAGPVPDARWRRHDESASTRHVPDRPEESTSTQFVPDGVVADASSTRFVPDGPDVSTSTRSVPDGAVADASSTRFVPDGPDDSTSTRFVPDGPARETSGLRELIARYDVDLPTFGRFRADALLGAGTMGTVYRAHDDVLGRDVAIKALRATSEPGVRERFLREARAVGAILHPNILSIYDAATHAGTPYLVMELATDGSLRERIQYGPLGPERVRELGIQIAQALAAAHGKSILHRDIKPANILAAKQGAWKLADFGIARMPDSTMTVDGQFVGSPSYAAPESLRAGQFSPASDVYGLAATLYEAVSGVPPHGDHDMTSVVKKLDQDPPPVTARRADVPAPIADAIMRGLARDPAQRPTARDFAVLLARTDADMVPVGPSRGLKLLAAAFATLAVVLLALVARSKWSSHTPNTAAPAAARADKAANAAKKVDRVPTLGGPAAGAPGAASPESTRPEVVDENGNPVDEETAKRILEQMERDAREETERWRKPKKGRRRGHDRWARDPWAFEEEHADEPSVEPDEPRYPPVESEERAGDRWPDPWAVR